MVNKMFFHKKTIFFLVHLFIFLAILGDIPLIILYTISGSSFLVNFLLYGFELIIMIVFAYLLLDSFRRRLPVFIYIYTGYILLFMLVSFLFNDAFMVLKDTRKFLTPLPPLLLGYYFALSFKEEREKYVAKLITFLTIMSVIGLIEWVWWFFSYDSIAQFYFKYFDFGAYYHYIRETADIDKSGIMMSGIRPAGFLIHGVFKRLTGFYCEPFSAGFNAALAAILILYSKIAGYRLRKRMNIFLIINIIALILTTSRGTYLFLFLFLFNYVITRRNCFGLLLLGSLIIFIFYGLLKKFFILTLGEPHTTGAILLFINYFSNNLFSFAGLLGQGIGSRWLGSGYEEQNLIYSESGYGAIFGQLGLFGLVSIFLLYLSAIAHVYFSKENKFFVWGLAISTPILLFFAGYPFGYKTYGLIYLFLGSIMMRPSFMGRSQ